MRFAKPCDKLRVVERGLDRFKRTSEDRPRLEARWNDLRGELGGERHRFQRELGELEDAKLEMEAEVEELVEAWVLVEGF